MENFSINNNDKSYVDFNEQKIDSNEIQKCNNQEISSNFEQIELLN